MSDPSNSLRIVTLAERPDLRAAAQAIADASWPKFMQQDTVSNRLWGRLMGDFNAYQGFLLAPDDTVQVYFNSIPVVWDGDEANLPESGWDWAFQNGVDALDRGIAPNTLSAIGIQIDPAYRSRGLSSLALKAMRSMAAERGFRALIAPVRPTLKHLYPLTSIDRYITWTNADGALFDPWLRVHIKLGARLIRPCHQSMQIVGSVAEWESWTNMAFPESGRYIVPSALEPVEIDREADCGRYVEPNVWMIHPVGGA